MEPFEEEDEEEGENDKRDFNLMRQKHLLLFSSFKFSVNICSYANRILFLNNNIFYITWPYYNCVDRIKYVSV